jgi:hypothetical protein
VHAVPDAAQQRFPVHERPPQHSLALEQDPPEGRQQVPAAQLSPEQQSLVSEHPVPAA